MNHNKGEYIFQARIKAKLTMEELGKKIGVSKSTIKKYENGSVKNIPYEKIELIASATGVSPAFIMGWEQLQENLNKENASFHAKILKDSITMNMLKEYYTLDEPEKCLVRNMVSSLAQKKD